MLDGADDAAASDGFATVPGRAPERLLLSLSGIVKEFPGVRALSGVDFDLRRGEVHAVCGENGAGKSTLMKIISGVHAPSAGRLLYKGVERRFSSPLEAEAAGIAMIHQELNLVAHLTVAENIFLGREPTRGFLVDRRALRAGAGPASTALRLPSIPTRWCATSRWRSASSSRSPRPCRSTPNCSSWTSRPRP